MNDERFLEAVERAARGVPTDGFHFGHREHLRLTWLQHDRLGATAGDKATAATLRRIDASHGGGQYHETVTRFWLGLVRHARERLPASDFDAALGAHPELLDRACLHRHYSAALLATEAARHGRLSPDLAPLPWEAVPGTAR